MVYILYNQEFEYDNDICCFTVPHLSVDIIFSCRFFKIYSSFIFFSKISISNLFPSPQPSVLPSLLIIKFIILSLWLFYIIKYPFKISNSMISSRFTELTSHHLIYFNALSSPHTEIPYLGAATSHFPTSSQSPTSHP